jgi:putative phage-type endonuclease
VTAAVALPARQRTPEWGKARQAGIGSSDAPVIAGVAPWGDIRTLFAEKMGWAAPVIETRLMSWGLRLEQVIAEAYAEETGRRVRRVRRLLQHRQHPWMLASLDRVAVGERRLVEIKTSRFANEHWGEPGSDEVPDHVRVQVEHQMAVTDYPLADVVVLFAGSDLRVYTVERDAELQVDLVNLEARFWRAVEVHSLPADWAELGERPVPLRAGEIEADEELTAYALRYRAAAADLKAMEEEADEAKRLIRERLADVTAARGDGFRISYKPQVDRRLVGWEQIAAAYRARLEQLGADPGELDTLHDLFTTTAPGIRPLRFTWSKETDDGAPL